MGSAKYKTIIFYSYQSFNNPRKGSDWLGRLVELRLQYYRLKYQDSFDKYKYLHSIFATKGLQKVFKRSSKGLQKVYKNYEAR